MRGAEALRPALAEASAEIGGAEALGGSGTMRDPAPPEPEPWPDASPIAIRSPRRDRP